MANKKSNKNKEEIIYFKLGNAALKFETPDGSVNLNKLSGKTSGSVSSKDGLTYNMVRRAIMHGTLIQTKKQLKNENPAKPINIEGMADEKARAKRDSATLLRKMKKDKLLEQIKSIKNHNLLSKMIEDESQGKNVSRRPRDAVIDTLKERLRELQKEAKSGMISYTETKQTKKKLESENNSE